jgi:hypothetical protein
MSSLLPAESCAGSRGPALKTSQENDTGVCPACGQKLHLGYAGLLPSHPPAVPPYTLAPADAK